MEFAKGKTSDGTEKRSRRPERVAGGPGEVEGSLPAEGLYGGFAISELKLRAIRGGGVHGSGVIGGLPIFGWRVLSKAI